MVSKQIKLCELMGGPSVPTYHTYQVLKAVQAACPDMLQDVKVNMEMFVEAGPAKGEDHGAVIINADPQEIGRRMACYEEHGIPIGTCWAINHWHGILTFANSTNYHPY